eukprot:scaffold139_cov324-Prasinococcus_capsulatus_cf.AAC.6
MHRQSWGASMGGVLSTFIVARRFLISVFVGAEWLATSRSHMALCSPSVVSSACRAWARRNRAFAFLGCSSRALEQLKSASLNILCRRKQAAQFT